MPLYWNISVFMLIYIFMVMCIFYYMKYLYSNMFYNYLEENINNKELKIYMW